MSVDQAGAEVVMPISDLHGRTVWTEDGRRLGTVRGMHTDEDGRLVSLDVRERWMLGPHMDVPVTGMRLDAGDVILPSSVGWQDDATEEEAAVGGPAAVASTPATTGAPVLLAGREGARHRFGGFDLMGSLFGALVIFGSTVLLGGVLAAIFDAKAVVIDTSLGSVSAVTDTTMLVGAATLFLASFLGGWCAGRSARYDGVANGLMTVVWVLAIGIVLGALGAWLGDQYDVYVSAGVPSFSTKTFEVWGSVAFVAALVLMLLGAALGGALGEHWHRRADRAMLDVVAVDEGATTSTGQVGSPVAPQPYVDDSDAAPVVHDAD